LVEATQTDDPDGSKRRTLETGVVGRIRTRVPAPPKRRFAGANSNSFDGERLKGSWVLVCMRSDKFTGKRNSWLLIKQRDKFAREDDGGALLQEDRSVASGNSMAQIASGKGRAPKSFILSSGSKSRSDAVWGSNRGDTGDSLPDGMTTKKPSRLNALASAARRWRRTDSGRGIAQTPKRLIAHAP
jgi:hypothetical protein